MSDVAPGSAGRPTGRALLVRILLVALGLAVSAGCAYLAFSGLSIESVGAALRGADYWWVVPAAAVTPVVLVMRTARWRRLFRDPSAVPPRAAFAALSIGILFSAVLPWRAGEVPRLVALRRTAEISSFEIATTIVVERVLDVISLALIGLAVWAFLPAGSWTPALLVLCGGLVGGFALFMTLLLLLKDRFPAFLEAVLRRLPLVSDERAHTAQLAIVAGTTGLTDLARLARLLGFSLLIWAVAGVSALLLLPAFGLGDRPLAAVLVIVTSTFAIAVPAGPGSVGVFEAAAQAALVLFGAAASVALSYAVIFHAVVLLPAVLIGLGSSWWLGRREATA
jgi:uncharacterized protein (TIRG00374 family)